MKLQPAFLRIHEFCLQNSLFQAFFPCFLPLIRSLYIFARAPLSERLAEQAMYKTQTIVTAVASTVTEFV